MRSVLFVSLLAAFLVFASVVPTVVSPTPAAAHSTGTDPTSTGSEALVDAVRERVSSVGGLAPTVLLLTGGYTYHETDSERSDADSDLLDNEVRSTVFGAITDSPGVYVAAVADETDVPRSTVRYHVRVLERAGLVFGEKIRGKQRYFPSHDDDPALTAALADDVLADVLRTIARVEPASTSELATELDRAPSTVSHHVSRLAEDGLVERERDGSAVLTRLADDVRYRIESSHRDRFPFELTADD